MGRKEAALNIEKHSVDFIDAVTIFERSLDELPKREHDYGEERFAVLGQAADGQVRFVVYNLARRALPPNQRKKGWPQ